MGSDDTAEGVERADEDGPGTEAASAQSDPTSERPAVPGLMSDRPRQGGTGPRTDGRWSQRPYDHPAAGWGAAASVMRVLARERAPLKGTRAMFDMNHEGRSYDCPGCAWPDDAKGLKLDICENGIKHVTWEMTGKRVDREFFAAHSVSELAEWTDFDLENQGRLTEPMVYDAATDHYVPISWSEAFELVGSELRALDDPGRATFYTSGRLGNEATFLYQLMVREYGTNNLPDCSNMCHEASGRALRSSLGTGKGTVDLHDWEQCDALFVLGANAASNAPRMLTALAEAYARGAEIVHVNPLVEAGATRTIVPHEFTDMARFKATPTSTLNLQVRPGGDLALMRGIAKVVLERARENPDVLDREFLESSTSGFEEYRELVEATSWGELVRQSGLGESDIREAADVYLRSQRALISWCLGVSQHEHGVDTVREIVNLLLLRGNIGREGAGPSPIRGHSNVQGNRTCGIDHRPGTEFLDRLAEVCRIDPPRAPGLDTVRSIEAMYAGELTVFVGMGGNFVRAAPDTGYTAEGLRRCELTVQISTKLNRSHLVHGKKAVILPCLGRTELDEQRGGLQSTSVEDAMSMVHLSTGRKRPASPHLLSEPAIIAGMARATLSDSATPWEWYVEDYDRIRDVMARVLPGFEDFNTRVRQPSGFRIPQAARDRTFHTRSGRAEFCHASLPDVIPESADVLVLQTMRSHDQWNTTIYSNNDRYRGVRNLRELIFMNADDMRERGIEEGTPVDIVATSKDGSQRSLREYRALTYNLPRGSAAGYMPEMNELIGAADYSTQSDQPLMKNVRVRVTPSASAGA
ncbi:oxidoreductase alpha (molybdopterin) subunit [Prauserella aidingensis]|uniref:FdhF/YdeP family oxidoreductase n=1 Tax=Prauserella aidingensis TaxID=387890 RepID=UPI0020A400F4|nr:FdhF/YdeP family oxidoreductase [Prauserella aidingensis]MCP2252751.1 oxidoreductase alpha (molybdopterin) subunit [Prauserella aidingensis]